jgi:hypothetical protein
LVALILPLHCCQLSEGALRLLDLPPQFFVLGGQVLNRVGRLLGLQLEPCDLLADLVSHRMHLLLLVSGVPAYSHTVLLQNL